MLKKVLIVLTNFILLFLLISINFGVTSQATFDVSTTFGGDVSKVPNATNTTAKIIGTALSIIRTVAAAIAIIIIIVIACKYMLSSAGDKADMKKYAINYVIGAFILFGATALISIIKEIVDASF
mgnify:CR=1 FL=1